MCTVGRYIEVMSITARYSSVCPTCNQPISPGDQVEWQRGAKAIHVVCPAGTASAAPAAKAARKTSRPSAPRYRDPRAGEENIARPSRKFGPYTVGVTLYITNVGGGGGQDGHYWTVVHAWSERANEDFGNYEAMERAYVVPATDDQVGPVAVRRAWRSVSDVAARVMSSVS
jgi:hypothetical protein